MWAASAPMAAHPALTSLKCRMFRLFGCPSAPLLPAADAYARHCWYAQRRRTDRWQPVAAGSWRRPCRRGWQEAGDLTRCERALKCSHKGAKSVQTSALALQPKTGPHQFAAQRAASPHHIDHTAGPSTKEKG